MTTDQEYNDLQARFDALCTSYLKVKDERDHARDLACRLLESHPLPTSDAVRMIDYAGQQWGELDAE